MFKMLPLLLLALSISPLLTHPAWAAVTKYELGDPEPLLDDAFYAGVARNGAPSVPTGRFVLNAEPSKDGTRIAMEVFSRNLTYHAVYVVDVGDSASWREITHATYHIAAPLCWSPDDSHVFADVLLVEVATGAVEQVLLTIDGNQRILRDPYSTTRPDNNWIVGPGTAGALVAAPILVDGTPDDTRAPIVFASLPGTVPQYLTLSPDGDAVAFANNHGQPLPLPDDSDIYVLTGLQAILDAPKVEGSDLSSLAPTSLSDPRILPIRTNEDSLNNFVHVPAWSQDQTLLFYGEDWNNTFNDDDFFNKLDLSNFDTMISRGDGTGPDVRIQEDGSNLIQGVTPGGIRLVQMSGTGTDLHVYMTTLKTISEIQGDDISGTEIIVDDGEGGGTTITLNDNAIQIPAGAEPETVADASGTSLVLPPGQVVQFPSGADREITISTPVTPATEAEFPTDAPVDAIPVIRQFGPSGTQFYPAIEVTIAYTDAEITDLREADLTPYLYNTATIRFDIPVPPTDIVARDLENNTITFRVHHFSTYGLAGVIGGPLPVAGLPTLLLLALLLLLATCWKLARATSI
jgi:hypothetical protein